MNDITYSELARKVGDCVLFNAHSNTDENWWEGLLLSPLLEKEIEEDNKDLEENEEPTTLLEYAQDIYQTYAITPEGARTLLNHTSELVSYSEVHDIFFWHVTHYGTSWTHVKTTWHEPKDEEYIYTIEEMLNLKEY